MIYLILQEAFPGNYVKVIDAIEKGCHSNIKVLFVSVETNTSAGVQFELPEC